MWRLQLDTIICTVHILLAVRKQQYYGAGNNWEFWARSGRELGQNFLRTFTNFDVGTVYFRHMGVQVSRICTIFYVKSVLGSVWGQTIFYFKKGISANESIIFFGVITPGHSFLWIQKNAVIRLCCLGEVRWRLQTNDLESTWEREMARTWDDTTTNDGRRTPTSTATSTQQSSIAQERDKKYGGGVRQWKITVTATMRHC
jgi:hypothetical protein